MYIPNEYTIKADIINHNISSLKLDAHLELTMDKQEYQRFVNISDKDKKYKMINCGQIIIDNCDMDINEIGEIEIE